MAILQSPQYLSVYLYIISMSISIYIYMGSISGPHLTLWVNKWSTETPKTNTKTATQIYQIQGRRVEGFLRKTTQKQTLKQKFWVNKWSTMAFKNLSQHVDDFDPRGTTYLPNFWHSKTSKTMPQHYRNPDSL